MVIKTRIVNTGDNAPEGIEEANDVRVCVTQWTGQKAEGGKKGRVCSHFNPV
jgi:hypothetical protein